jgi:hypothetical protein
VLLLGLPASSRDRGAGPTSHQRPDGTMAGRGGDRAHQPKAADRRHDDAALDPSIHDSRRAWLG